MLLSVCMCNKETYERMATKTAKLSPSSREVGFKSIFNFFFIVILYCLPFFFFSSEYGSSKLLREKTKAVFSERYGGVFCNHGDLILVKLDPAQRRTKTWPHELCGALTDVRSRRAARTVLNLTFGKTYQYWHIPLSEHNNAKRLNSSFSSVGGGTITNILSGWLWNLNRLM